MKKRLSFMKKSRKFFRIIIALVLLVAASASITAIFTGGVCQEVYALFPNEGDQGGQMIELQPMDEGGAVVNPEVQAPNGQVQENPAANPGANQPNNQAKKGLDAGAIRERCGSVAKAINYLSSAAADLIRGIKSGNVQAWPMAIATLKSATNVFVTFLNKLPGIGGITDAVFDAFVSIVEAFDGAKQSDMILKKHVRISLNYLKRLMKALTLS